MINDSNAADRSSSERDNAFDELTLTSASFVEFDQWMDMELARLVQRWIHTAAPNANRPQVDRTRFGH